MRGTVSEMRWEVGGRVKERENGLWSLGYVSEITRVQLACYLSETLMVCM